MAIHLSSLSPSIACGSGKQTRSWTCWLFLCTQLSVWVDDIRRRTKNPRGLEAGEQYSGQSEFVDWHNRYNFWIIVWGIYRSSIIVTVYYSHPYIGVAMQLWGSDPFQTGSGHTAGTIVTYFLDVDHSDSARMQGRAGLLPEAVWILSSCLGGGDMGETSFPGGARHVGSTHQAQGQEGKEEVEGVWKERQRERDKGKWSVCLCREEGGVVRRRWYLSAMCPQLGCAWGSSDQTVMDINISIRS